MKNYYFLEMKNLPRFRGYLSKNSDKMIYGEVRYIFCFKRNCKVAVSQERFSINPSHPSKILNLIVPRAKKKNIHIEKHKFVCKCRK